MPKELSWKPNLLESKKRHFDWWKQKSLVVASYYDVFKSNTPRTDVPECEPYQTLEQYYTDNDWLVRWNEWKVSQQSMIGDTLPIAHLHYGPGALALYLGCEGDLFEDTVWYHPIWKEYDDVEDIPSLQFDSGNRWWKLTLDLARKLKAASHDKFLVRSPDLIENLDILASLRDNETMLIDMIEEPEWVEKQVRDINQVFFKCFDELHDIIKLDDGSSVGHFALWGPGKTYKVQCDAAALISVPMFDRFVIPVLQEQCDYLDSSMYHLDGPEAVQHLDSLLAIDSMSALQWTPGAGAAPAGDKRWFPIYEKTLNSGKALQINSMNASEVLPFLEEFGEHKGIYIVVTDVENEDEFQRLWVRLEKYR